MMSHAELVEELVKLLPPILRRVKPDPQSIGDWFPANLAYSEVRILVHLAVFGDKGSTALADAIGMSRPAVTEAIDRLLARDLVEREPCPHDRRRVIVRLTPAATSVAERMVNRWRVAFGRALDELTPGEQENFFKGMSAFSAALAESAMETTPTVQSESR